MTLEVTDKSGQPRSDQDLQEGIDTLTRIMAAPWATAQPELLLVIPTLLDCLRELQALRVEIKKKFPDYGR